MTTLTQLLAQFASLRLINLNQYSRLPFAHPDVPVSRVSSMPQNGSTAAGVDSGVDETQENVCSCHPAIQIPEILLLVFQHLPARDCWMCARVCLAWSEPALDKLWSNMHGLEPLVKLAGTLVVTQTGMAYKDAILTDAGWAAFSKMASRIRCLDVDMARDLGGRSLSPDVALKLLYRLKSSPQVHILPGLTHLTWVMQAAEEVGTFLAFTPPTLEDLNLLICLPAEGQSEQGHSLVRSIGSIAPRLHRLRLSTRATMLLVETSLARAITQLPGLSKLELPDVQATGDILEAVATCAKLVDLELRYQAVTEDSLQAFMEKLASSCPQLQTLVIHLPTTLPDPTSIKLRFELLRPLFRCHALRSLKVHHPRFVSMAQATLADDARSWTGLKSLNLSAGVTPPCPTGTRLAALGLYAEFLGGTLEELGQQFNCRIVPGGPSNGPRFYGLRVLHVGKSHVDDTNTMATAEYLGSICPRGVRIVVEATGAPSQNRWPAVQKMVDMVHRAQEMGYRRRLEEEAEGHSSKGKVGTAGVEDTSL